MYELNATHDPALKSWLDSANRADTDFPIQNLPFGVFRRRGGGEPFRGGVALGDQIVDLAAEELRGVCSQMAVEGGAMASTGVPAQSGTPAQQPGLAARALEACGEPTLNTFFASGRASWSALRAFLSEVLRAGSPHAARLRPVLVPQSEVEYAVPVRIGDYTDFYASIYHATSVGRLFRPDNPLLPNYKWVPIGYHGRSSSVRVSGDSFARPLGQIMPKGESQPFVAPCRSLDYELEVGIFIGTGNALGERVALEAAEEHVFGVCLLNDWSARDIQAWEYQPLGPFLAKSFATTVSPWVVTLEALAPFRAPWTRSEGDPQPLPYLEGAGMRAAGAIDLQLEAWLETEQMRKRGLPAQRLSHSSFRHSYWTIAQLVAHHTVNGCNLAAGDLLGSGTQSGPAPEEAGSLLELSEGGKRPLTLNSGETRTYLLDGDRVIFRGWCERPGFARIGLGEASGLVQPPRG